MDAHGDTLQPHELLAELGWVRALARSLVLDPDVTDDVLQQVCLLALQKVPRGARTGPRLRAWLAAVTRSLARRTQRSDLRRRRRELAAAQPEALPSTAELAAHREALQGLVAAVTTLQEPYFSAIMARYFEGLEVADIAARDGIKPAAVRQRLSRARAQLRGRLQQLVADDRDGWLAGALALPVGAALKVGTVSPAATAPAGRVTADIGHLGGRLVAQQAGKGAAGKIAAAFVLGVGVLFVAWHLLREAPEVGGRPVVLTAPEATPGERALPAPDRPAPAALEPAAMLAPADAAPSPWSFAGKSVTAPAPDATPHSFRLVVVDREARPVAGALVETCVRAGQTAPANPLVSQAIFSTVTTTFTDSIGRCNATLSPMEQTLLVSKEGVGSSGRRDARMLERARNADGDIVIALLPFLVIRGQVLNADGSPASGLPVLIRPTGADTLTGGPRLVPPLVTDADGHFETMTDHSNQFSIGTIGSGLPAERIVNPKPGESIDITLQLPGDWQLGGTVLDEAGAPVVGARVMALRLPDEEPAETVLYDAVPKDSAWVDAPGAFALRLRKAGTYLVAAFAKGRPMSAPQQVRIEGTRSRQALALTLEPPATISGSVVAAGGAPAAAGMSVVLQPVPPTMLGELGMFGPRLL
ncbi:MAG TPA: sigma-70 family RNA polymerase sigma factor, partial [Planctomycetota bacterium]|nr:sigma-70 family RNA polymerase sigma factor [Planctomycetota bacterium]